MWKIVHPIKIITVTSITREKWNGLSVRWGVFRCCLDGDKMMETKNYYSQLLSSCSKVNVQENEVQTMLKYDS